MNGSTMVFPLSLGMILFDIVLLGLLVLVYCYKLLFHWLYITWHYVTGRGGLVVDLEHCHRGYELSA